jgi:hypothetical protein
MKMEQCFETSAYKIQTTGNYTEENIQHTEHGENLKSRIYLFHCNKIGDCALWGRKFQVHISPCVLNHYITKYKLEWRYSLDIWRKVGGQFHDPAVLRLANSSQYSLDKRLCCPEILSRQCRVYKSLAPTWNKTPILLTSWSQPTHYTNWAYPGHCTWYNHNFQMLFWTLDSTMYHSVFSNTVRKRVPIIQIRINYWDFGTWEFFFFFFFVGAEPGLCSPDALRPVGLLCTA